MKVAPIHIHEESLYWESMVLEKNFARHRSEIERKAVLRAHSLATRSTTALDIGCEGGRWSKLLSDLGWKLICTDIDQRNLDICQKRNPTATCICVSQEDTRLSCDRESIELILCIGVEPVINARWFIDESFRVLKREGLIVGVFPNHSSWRGLMYRFIPSLRAKVRGRDWFGYPFSYPEWRKRFCSRGFTMMYEEGYGWPPFRITSNSPLVPVATSIERYLGLRKLVNLSPWIVFIARKDG